jgi:putative intracellular protease/amidase
MIFKPDLGGLFAIVLSCGFATAAYSTDNLPSKFGVAVYPTFEALDVFGPLNILNMLAYSHTMNLTVLAKTLDPVSTQPPPKNNTAGSTFGESIVPTHTFDNPPSDLEVLLVPGGVGAWTEEFIAPVVDFVKETYPKLRYLVSVCTGGAILAQSGVLDGRNATTNKKSWDWVCREPFPPSHDP